jgi:hypothetical protein
MAFRLHGNISDATLVGFMRYSPHLGTRNVTAYFVSSQERQEVLFNSQSSEFQILENKLLVDIQDTFLIRPLLSSAFSRYRFLPFCLQHLTNSRFHLPKQN